MTRSTLSEVENEKGAPIDINPAVECSECGEFDSWEEIQGDQNREGGWRISKDPDKPPVCPDCMAATRRHERRLAENYDISEFAT